MLASETRHATRELELFNLTSTVVDPDVTMIAMMRLRLKIPDEAWTMRE